MSTVLDVSKLPVEETALYVPQLGELIEVLQNGLKANFERVSVRAVTCPDLTKAPWGLAAPGLCGDRTALVDIGGPPYLLPTPQKDRVYDLAKLAKRLGFDESLVIGAGAGPWPYVGVNCEGIYNVYVKNGVAVKNETRTARVDKATGDYVVETLPLDQSNCALLANLLLTPGKPGQVIEVECEIRTGSDNFVSCMRNCLTNFYKDKFVGLGGVFVLQQGSARQHVMPDFSPSELHTEEQLNDWLKFYEMPAPLTAVGTLVTDAPDGAKLDLRPQHFHSWGPKGAGHYHCDTTPRNALYRACLVPANTIYRVDRPTNTHQVGRD